MPLGLLGNGWVLEQSPDDFHNEGVTRPADLPKKRKCEAVAVEAEIRRYDCALIVALVDVLSLLHVSGNPDCRDVSNAPRMREAQHMEGSRPAASRVPDRRTLV